MGREDPKRDAFTKESANVAFFLKQSWGGVGKRVERDGSFCMRDQCLMRARRYSMASML